MGGNQLAAGEHTLLPVDLQEAITAQSNLTSAQMGSFMRLLLGIQGSAVPRYRSFIKPAARASGRFIQTVHFGDSVSDRSQTTIIRQHHFIHMSQSGGYKWSSLTRRVKL